MSKNERKSGTSRLRRLVTKDAKNGRFVTKSAANGRIEKSGHSSNSAAGWLAPRRGGYTFGNAPGEATRVPPKAPTGGAGVARAEGST